MTADPDLGTSPEARPRKQIVEPLASLGVVQGRVSPIPRPPEKIPNLVQGQRVQAEMTQVLIGNGHRVHLVMTEAFAPVGLEIGLQERDVKRDVVTYDHGPFEEGHDRVGYVTEKGGVGPRRFRVSIDLQSLGLRPCDPRWRDFSLVDPAGPVRLDPDNADLYDLLIAGDQTRGLRIKKDTGLLPQILTH